MFKVNAFGASIELTLIYSKLLYSYSHLAISPPVPSSSSSYVFFFVQHGSGENSNISDFQNKCIYNVILMC